MSTVRDSSESRRAGVEGKLNLAFDFCGIFGMSGILVATPGVTRRDLLLIGAYNDTSELALDMLIVGIFSTVGDLTESFLAGGAAWKWLSDTIEWFSCDGSSTRFSNRFASYELRSYATDDRVPALCQLCHLRLAPDAIRTRQSEHSPGSTELYIGRFGGANNHGIRPTGPGTLARSLGPEAVLPPPVPLRSLRRPGSKEGGSGA
ncbi:hypothetical protein SCUP234_01240 [Seiridium cupressi]